MNTNLKLSRRIASILLLSVVLAGCASGPFAPSTDLLRQIESATTRADHESLAARYDKEAASARATAVEHRKMAQSYQGMVAGGRGGASMVAHCNAIVRSQESIAVEFEAMAAAHRQLAAQAKP
jgi:PBP1b-binding outer membrane lipoprotein LpoB